jgi:hypothetical protein
VVKCGQRPLSGRILPSRSSASDSDTWHWSVLRERRGRCSLRRLPGEDYEHCTDEDEPDRGGQDRGGHHRKRRSREDGGEPESDGTTGNGTDDADHHPFGEGETEQRRRTPTRGREHGLLARAIPEIRCQPIGDAEGTEQERQHRGYEVNAAHLHAHYIAECRAHHLTLKCQLHGEQHSERRDADEQAERAAHQARRPSQQIRTRDPGPVTHRAVAASPPATEFTASSGRPRVAA